MRIDHVGGERRQHQLVPSGGVLAELASAMLPPCPGLFSTITGWPSAGSEPLGEQPSDEIGRLARRKADQDARAFGGLPRA